MRGYPFYLKSGLGAVCMEVVDNKAIYIYQNPSTGLFMQGTCPAKEMNKYDSAIYSKIPVYAHITETHKSNDMFDAKQKREEFVSAMLRVTTYGMHPDHDGEIYHPFVVLETGRIRKTYLSMLVEEVNFSFPTISKTKKNK